MLAQEEEKAVEAAPPVVNDFTFQAATINGSGSQSSNLVLTVALFSMGCPVAPKNVLPSNIEGLPTWFNIRVSPEGYQCVNGEVNVLVALNPTTWQRDIHGVNAGAALLHAESSPAVGHMKPEDVHHYAVPFHRLGQENIDNPDLRKYLTNMIYVGGGAGALGPPLDVLTPT